MPPSHAATTTSHPVPSLLEGGGGGGGGGGGDPRVMAPLTGTFEREGRGLAPPFIAARALPLPCTQVVRRVFGQKGEESPRPLEGGEEGGGRRTFMGSWVGGRGELRGGRGEGKDRVPSPPFAVRGGIQQCFRKKRKKPNIFFIAMYLLFIP